EIEVRSVSEKVFVQERELLRRHRLVVVPPDLRVGVNIPHDELVFWRTPGVLASRGDKRSVSRQPRLTAAKRVLDQFGGTKIVVNGARGLQTADVDPVVGIAQADFCHLHHQGPEPNRDTFLPTLLQKTCPDWR